MTTKHKFGVGEYTMRNGLKATVYEVCNVTGSLIGAVDCKGGGRVSASWYSNGNAYRDYANPYNLMPPKRKAWINVASDGFVGSLHKTKSEAEEHSKYRANFAYCIEVEIPE